MSAAAFWLVFLGIYPVGFFTRPSLEMLPLNATYSGLAERYEVGDNLKFSILYVGNWYSSQDYTIKIKQIDNADGEVINKIIWFSTEIEEISEAPPEQPIAIEHAVDIGKNPSDPLTLSEAGLYAVNSEGKNVADREKYFRVNEP
ncbi:MAG TPA: hypothetical protein VJ742_08055 [Nitrososphaera sp.]|nr:hypothetical protein [Nitrososphaera sp.]